MLIAIDVGLSAWTLLELLTNKPVIPTPVGLPQFDYRTLHMWQWYAGIAVAVAVLILLAAEVLAGWFLHARLESEETDMRYDKVIARDMGLEEGSGLLGGGGGGGNSGGSSGGSGVYHGGSAAPSPASAPRARDASRGEPQEVGAAAAAPAVNEPPEELTEDERLRRREHIARAAEHRVASITR